MKRIVLIVLFLGLPACGSAGDMRLVSGGEGSVAPEGAELLDLLDSARSLTFNARYAARSDDPEVSTANLTVEIWRKPPYVRQDTTTVEGRLQTQTATIGRPEDVVHCTKDEATAWSCRSRPRAEAAGFDDLLTKAQAQVTGAVVKRSSQRIEGRPSSCYDVGRPGGGSSQLCVDDGGVPVRMSSFAGRLELTSLQTKVSDSVFTPPGPVT